ncbi:hypothetical protein GBA52_011984 [Prunus armeniaca]|nr:hypothetical protein GBA52_011984 [Prunus armeniaca]
MRHSSLDYITAQITEPITSRTQLIWALTFRNLYITALITGAHFRGPECESGNYSKLKFELNLNGTADVMLTEVYAYSPVSRENLNGQK